MYTKRLFASVLIGFVLIGTGSAGAVDWTGYTRETDQVGGLIADGVYDGVFNYSYAGQWGLGSVKHYMELLKDAEQIGVDGEGYPLYEYIIVQYCQPKTGYNIRQYFFGFDNDQIVNTYDLTATYGPDFDRVPAEFYTNTMADDGYIEPGIIPNWFATWDPNPAVDWAWSLPDDMLSYDESWYGNHLSPGPLLDAGESIDLWPGIAPAPDDEDMMFIFPAGDGFGYGIVGWATVQRIVTTQRLADGDLEWSEENLDNRQPVLGRFFEPLAAGDFDEDGDVDVDDIDLLCDNMGVPLFDLDGDGDADEDDLIKLIEELVELTDGSGRVGTKRGDFDLNGLINATDLATMNAGFGTSGLGYGGGNANCDDLINATDLAILAANFGYVAPAGAVPEPVTMSLLALGGLAVLRRRRK